MDSKAEAIFNTTAAKTMARVFIPTISAMIIADVAMNVEGAELTGDGMVDEYDLSVFADLWLTGI